MTDTAQTEEVVEVAKPFLDLDAMLEDLHNGFPQEEAEVETPTVENGTADTDVPGDEPGSEDQTESDPALEAVLPPGYVQVGDEVLPENEWKALLELNRRVKDEPGPRPGSAPPSWARSRWSNRPQTPTPCPSGSIQTMSKRYSCSASSSGSTGNYRRSRLRRLREPSRPSFQRRSPEIRGDRRFQDSNEGVSGRTS